MPAPRPPADPGKPTPREALAKATAAAGPKVAKAVEAAGPKVEKAATTAGKLLGTLRDRAKDTAKQFSQGYGGPAGEGAADESSINGSGIDRLATDDTGADGGSGATPGSTESSRRRPKPGRA